VVKLILDADAAIKLSKIGLIWELANAFEIILTKEVYEEQVVVGLKKGYSDAKRVDILVKSKKIGVKEVESIYDDSKLGKGEKSMVDYCLSVGADLVVSDDEASLKVLDGLSIPYTPVAGSILMLVRHRRITKEEGIKYLSSLKDMIKDEHLFYVKSRLEGL
jgi:predicted nucleic acid-binding protein